MESLGRKSRSDSSASQSQEDLELTEEEKYRKDVLKQKRVLRRYLRLKRNNYFKNNEEMLTEEFFVENYLEKINKVLDENQDLIDKMTGGDPSKVIELSSYYPINSEVNIMPVIWKLMENPKYKFNHSLPTITTYEDPLLFLRYNKEDEIIMSKMYKVFEPSKDSKKVYPQVLIIPLMGFMEDCHRIGYGKGFYDRSIVELKEIYDDNILMIGVAFEAQKFDRFTGKLTDQDVWGENQNSKISKMRQKFKDNSNIQWVQLDSDEAVDYIVTEKKVYRKKDHEQSLKK